MTQTGERTASELSPPQGSPHTERRSWRHRVDPALLAGLLGVVAVLAGALLPFAPVNMARVDVTWPDNSSAVRSTALILADQSPHALDLRFAGADLQAATRASDGLVFATIRPDLDDAARKGLVVTATAGEVVIRSGGQTATSPWSAQDQWVVRSDQGGLLATRNGTAVASWPTVLQPQVDALLTSVKGASSTLNAHVLVADDGASTPTVLKILLMVALVAAGVLALVALRADDRRRGPPGDDKAQPRTLSSRLHVWVRGLSLPDVLVALGMLLWIFIGPMTDDDGYYAVMSLNDDASGYVGNYYQISNQSYTPFTWFWQFLDYWQRLGGRSPVWLRVPALVAALVAWVLARRFLGRTMAEQPRLAARLAPWLLAVVFLAWWFPYSVGDRPEILAAAGTVVVLTLTWRALERRVLLPAALAALVAGLAFAAHPTGAVAFGPLLLAVPRLWQIARAGSSRVWHAVARTAAVLSVGSFALLAGFWDGTLRDFTVTNMRVKAVDQPLTWKDEIDRYEFLLGQAPMGSFAKRAVVLVTLVLLLWFVVTYAAARFSARTAVSSRLPMIGFSCGLAFILLWITPSKWTHHFGALASIGPLFVAGFALTAPSLARQLFRDRPCPVWLAPLAAASLLPPILLALNGPNAWAYSWYDAFFSPADPPTFRGVQLGSTALWVALVILLLGVGVVRFRPWRWRRPSAGQAWMATALVAAFFLMDLAYLTAAFVKTAVPRDTAFSVAAANLQDASGHSCLIDDAVSVWDASTGTRLQRAATPPEQPTGPSPFSQGAGTAPDRPVPQVSSPIWSSWGSDQVGTTRSPWQVVPTGAPARSRLGFLAAGGPPSNAQGQFALETGVLADGKVTDVTSVPVPDDAPIPGWRSLAVPVPVQPARGQAVVRVVASDTSAAVNYWGAFSEPVLVAPTTMKQFAPPGSPTVVAWQSTFWFPCDRPPVNADGILEPPRYATTFGTVGPDIAWDVDRGGPLGSASRLASVVSPQSELKGFAPPWGRLYKFEYPVAESAYTLQRSSVTALGWTSPFGKSAQIIRYEQNPPPPRR